MKYFVLTYREYDDEDDSWGQPLTMQVAITPLQYNAWPESSRQEFLSIIRNDIADKLEGNIRGGT